MPLPRAHSTVTTVDSFQVEYRYSVDYSGIFTVEVANLLLSTRLSGNSQVKFNF